MPKWQKLWNRLKKKDKELTVENRLKADIERTFLHKLCIKFINILESISLEGKFLNIINLFTSILKKDIVVRI